MTLSLPERAALDEAVRRKSFCWNWITMNGVRVMPAAQHWPMIAALIRAEYHRILQERSST